MYNRYLSVFKKHYPAKRLAPLLAMIVALSPFAIDTYLPAIPTMAKFFQVDIQLIELSIPLYLIGFSLGQIMGGPISAFKLGTEQLQTKPAGGLLKTNRAVLIGLLTLIRRHINEF